MTFIANHVYTIANRTQYQGNNMMIGLSQANSANGTPCQILIQSNTEDTFNQQWLVKEVPGNPQIYTLQNIRTGSYLYMAGGSAANGARVQGWSALSGTAQEKSQQWKIVTNGNYMKIQNVSSGTYLDLLNGNTATGTQVCGWANRQADTQDWFLRRMSRSDVEVRAIVSKDPRNTSTFQSFRQDTLYLVLPKSVRDAIYVKSGLKNIKGRGQLFDSDDYAFVLKAEVAKWGIATLLADDFGILWGIMFGEQGSRGLAYNFYLNENLDNVIFFEPYSGEEKLDMQFKSYFAVF